MRGWQGGSGEPAGAAADARRRGGGRAAGRPSREPGCRGRVGGGVGGRGAGGGGGWGRGRGGGGWQARRGVSRPADAAAGDDTNSDEGGVLPVLPAPLPRTAERALARTGELIEAPPVF